MNSRYSLEQIAGFILASAKTDPRYPYNSEPLVQSSKKIVEGLQSGSISESELNTACHDVMTYFGSDISDKDIEVLVAEVLNLVPMPL